MENKININPTSKLIPLSEWQKHYPWPTVPALRWFWFNRAENGFDAAVVRCGRRLLVDPVAFFAWVRKQDQRQGGGQAK